MKDLTLSVGQKVVILDFATKNKLSTGRVVDLDSSTQYPIRVEVSEPFIAGHGEETMSFFPIEAITFNHGGLFRGVTHNDHKEFDLEVMSEDTYQRFYLERTSSTYRYLMNFFSKEAVKVSEDVDKAIALLIPHIKSGKLSVDAVKMILEENL